jgi:hypothetical protein
MKKIIFFLPILFFIILNFGCKDSLGDSGGNVDFPVSNVSYSQHVQPLFNYKCTYSSCHGVETTSSRLVLASYYDATKYPGIIVPKLPDNSILIQRLDGRLQPRMPLSRDTLSRNNYNGLRTWIKEGALNN